MIVTTSGNIFDSNCEALVNPVNINGVMGKGLALEFKKQYPDMFDQYKIFCNKGILKIGTLYTYKTTHTRNPKYIINFPTKTSFARPSQVSFIKKGLKALRIRIEELNLKSIAIPAIGCGLGGLKYAEILNLIISDLMDLNGTMIKLYEPIIKNDKRVKC